MAATESLVDYLRSMFGTDIRAIIPQIALSGGTMIALACKEIIMGKHSSLGPIDPQFNGMPAHGIIEEFNQAAHEIKADQSKIPLWQMIFK
jgi:ClpP class serine protease